MTDADGAIARVRRRLIDPGRRAPLRPIGLGTREEPLPPEVDPLPLDSLRAIEDLDREEMVVTALSGTPVDEIARAASEAGLILCPLIPIGTPGSLGGLFASGEESPAAPVEGHLRDAVLGIEGFTGAGAPLRSGGRVVKNVTGYDLTRFLSGSRGTLAVITRLHWRLRRAPEVWLDVAARVETRALGRQLRALRTIPDPTAVRVDRTGRDAEIHVLLEGGRATTRARADQVAKTLGGPIEVTELDATALVTWLDLGEGARTCLSTREWIAHLEGENSEESAHLANGPTRELRVRAFPFVGPGRTSGPVASDRSAPGHLAEQIRQAWDPKGVLWNGVPPSTDDTGGRR